MVISNKETNFDMPITTKGISEREFSQLLGKKLHNRKNLQIRRNRLYLSIMSDLDNLINEAAATPPTDLQEGFGTLEISEADLQEGSEGDASSPDSIFEMLEKTWVDLPDQPLSESESVKVDDSSFQ